MDKLLRYKQMAKDFAHERDAEAVELAEKLRDEQQKVLNMERRIAENASQIISRPSAALHGSDGVLNKLTKQTALAVQYRQRVQELEAQLDDKEKLGEDGLQGWRRRQVASPRTQKLYWRHNANCARRGRKSKSWVNFASRSRPQSSAESCSKGHPLEGSGETGGARSQDLEAQLKAAMEESTRKDKAFENLQAEFAAFKKKVKPITKTPKQCLKEPMPRFQTLGRRSRL